MRSENLTTPITADQPIAEAVRTILADQLIALRDNEARYRSGDLVEGVHKMRVSLRRMRTLVRLYGDRFDEQALREHVVGMRKTARKLGAVRDLDVLIEHLQEYQRTLPEGEQAQFDPLLQLWQKRQQTARKALDAYLDSKAYRRFLKRLDAFTSRRGSGVVKTSGVTPHQVRHILNSSIWRRYEAVWAYAPVLDDADDETLHALRIECKFLRYSLEFFTDVLDETKAAPLIAPVVALQELLGDIHDASVAREIMGITGHALTPAVENYLIRREGELAHLTETLPKLWSRLDNLRYRRKLAAMLAAL